MHVRSLVTGRGLYACLSLIVHLIVAPYITEIADSEPTGILTAFASVSRRLRRFSWGLNSLPGFNHAGKSYELLLFLKKNENSRGGMQEDRW